MFTISGKFVTKFTLSIVVLSAYSGAHAQSAGTETRAPNPSVESPSVMGQTSYRTEAIVTPNTNDNAKARHDKVYPARGGGWGPATGSGFWSARWMEDWTDVPRDKSNVLSRLKDIPLSSDGDVRLTLNGQFRIWTDYSDHFKLKDGDSNAVLFRTVVGAELAVGDHVRAYAEIANGMATGHEPATVNLASERNDAVLLQAFVEGHGNVGKGEVGAMFGRMEFWDGPPQLQTSRDNRNIHTPWNGGRVYGEWGHVRFDAVKLYGFTFGSGGLGDDKINDDEKLTGLIVGTRLPTGKLGKIATQLFLDGYYYKYTVDRRWGTTSGTDERSMFGAYLRGDIGPINVDVSLTLQDGSFANRNVSAYGVFGRANVLLASGPMQPRLGMRFDRASGGGAYGNGTLHNFSIIHGQTPLTTSNYQLIYTNSQFVGPQLSFSPLKAVTVTSEYSHVTRLNSKDAVYDGTIVPYAGTQLVEGKAIADVARLRINWAVNPHVAVQFEYDHIDAGTVLQRAGFKSQNYLNGRLSLRF